MSQIAPVSRTVETENSVGLPLTEAKDGGTISAVAAPDEFFRGQETELVLTAAAERELLASSFGTAPDEFIRTQSHPAPTDPLYPTQWHLIDSDGVNHNTAWHDYNGTGIKVAVFDQGIDSAHTDLDARYSAALSVRASDLAAGGNPVLAGDNHGTAVAGIIASELNGVGTVGIAYNATLVSIYSSLAGTNASFAAETVNAYNHAATNADVLNNSWGFGNAFFQTPNAAFIDNFLVSPFTGAGTAVANAGTNGRGGLGTVIVQSAGNARQYGDDTNLHSYQNNRFTVTVAATLDDGFLSSYSTPGASILVAAPGSPSAGTIVTTDRSGTAGYNTNAGSAGDYTTSFNGTSAAAPMVSGVVALMLDANPLLGNRDVQEILAYSARQSGSAASYAINGARDWNGGGLHTSRDYGYGLVDATAAVRLAETWTTQKTWSNVQTTASGTINVGLAIPDGSPGTGASTAFNVAGVGRLQRIEILLNVTHTWIGDLTATLTSPSGTVSTLLNRPGYTPSISGYEFGSQQDNINFVFDSAQFWGEDPNGNWTIRITDLVSPDPGTFNSFQVTTYADAPTANDLYIYTNELSNFAGVSGHSTTLTDTDGGIDTINAAAVTLASTINLNAGTNSTIDGVLISIAGGTTIENVFSGDGDDSLTGNAVGNRLDGGRGNDTLIGGAGADTLVGGANTAVGDTASYTGSAIGVVVDLLTNANFGGDAAGDSLSGIENVTGSGQSDILLGGIDANVLEGGGGADFIFGRFGADTIRGGADGDTLFGDDASGFPEGTPGILYGADSIYGEGGNDNIYGEGGADFIDGGADIDTANYSTSPFGISVFLQSGQGFGPTGSYAAGDTFANIENVVGTAFNDQIFGNASANTLEGAGGSDTMAGSLGSDIMVGGSGVDYFIFSSVSEGGPGGDIITDFTDNTDVLDLRTLFTAHSLSTVNPVGSGVLIVRALGPGSPHTEIAIDLDGSAGGGPAFNIATLLNITPGLLSVGSDILVA